MSYVEVLFLGVLQGVAEFLPISSSGHLVIAEALIGNQRPDSLELNIALHLATLLSILAVYRGRIVQSLSQPKILGAVIVATLPIVVVGICFKDYLESAFNSPLVAGAGLLVTAGLLLATKRMGDGKTALADIDFRSALIVGLFQAIAPIPGISRAGSTIVGGLLAGLTREAAAEFSFLIAIPAIAGASVLEGREILQRGATPGQGGILLLGMAAAFIVGFFALRGLLAVLARRRLHWFAYYCAAVGCATIVWQLTQ